MRVGLIFDRERLEQEHAMLSRLVVGLLAEGIAVTRLIPDNFDPFSEDVRERRIGLVSRLSYPARPLPWLRGAIADRLSESLERAMPDLFHAIGEQSWRLATVMAQRMERPLVLDVWSAPQAKTAPARRQAAAIAAYLVPTEPIGEALGHRVDPDLVRLVTPSIGPAPTHTSVLERSDEEVVLAVIGEGRDLAAYRDLLGGIRRLVDERPQVQVVMEIKGPHGHDVWRCARSLDLLPFVSSIADAGPMRTPLMQCDLLVVPERTGVMRSVLIEAMAAGVLVVAASDPMLRGVLAPDTAEIVETPSPERWYRTLIALIADPLAARRRAVAVQSLAMSRFQSSDQVAGVIAAYEEALADTALPFARDADQDG